MPRMLNAVLGSNTGMFLAWFNNSKLSGLTFIKKTGFPSFILYSNRDSERRSKYKNLKKIKIPGLS